MQGETLLIRRSFAQFISQIQPYINNVLLRTKTDTLIMVLKDTNKSVLEIYQQVQSIHQRSTFSPNNTQSHLFYKPGLVGSPKILKSFDFQGENTYYSKGDQITPAELSSQDRSLKSLTNSKNQSSFIKKKTSHQLFSTTSKGNKFQTEENETYYSKRFNNILGSGWETPRNLNQKQNDQFMRKMKTEHRSSAGVSAETLIKRISLNSLLQKQTFESLCKKKRQPTFTVKDKLLTQIRTAQQEFKKGQTSLSYLYTLTHDTSQSWFHDHPQEEPRNRILSKNLVYNRISKK